MENCIRLEQWSEGLASLVVLATLREAKNGKCYVDYVERGCMAVGISRSSVRNPVTSKREPLGLHLSLEQMPYVEAEWMPGVEWCID